MGTFTRYRTRNETKLSQTKQIFKKMKFIIPLIALFVVFASASSDGKEDNKAVYLAEKLAQAREETKQFVERENNKLRQEDEKIKKDADKIKKDAEKLRQENEKIKRENRRLRKAMAKIRRDNSQIKKIQRQKMQKDNNITLELERIIQQQIDKYLQENKVCVAGSLEKVDNAFNKDFIVDFGHKFARVPTFSASLMGFTVQFKSVPDYGLIRLYVKNVTSSSAKLFLNRNNDYNLWYAKIAWLACL